MTPEQIQHWAREAGFRTGHITIKDGSTYPFIQAVSATDCEIELQTFANLVRNATLEEAAVIVMESAYRSNGTSSYEHVAQKIRSLKT